MEGISVGYFLSSIDPGNNKEQYSLHSYIIGDNEQDACDSHDHMFYLFKKLESVISVSGMSTVWEDS